MQNGVRAARRVRGCPAPPLVRTRVDQPQSAAISHNQPHNQPQSAAISRNQPQSGDNSTWLYESGVRAPTPPRLYGSDVVRATLWLLPCLRALPTPG